MTEQEKHINEMIEFESTYWFSDQEFSEETFELQHKLNHYAAKNDMISWIDGTYRINEEFKNIIVKYRESVRKDFGELHNGNR